MEKVTMQKINVVGTSGSGKSTVAAAMAKKLNCPYVQLDALFWKDHWQESSDTEFFTAIEKALDCDRWVLDGNYDRCKHIKWRDVDTIVWINYGFWRTLKQALGRAFKRIISQDELWGKKGTQETWGKLFSRDSIIWWTIKTYHNNIERYETMMADPKYQHLQYYRLRSPAEVRDFIANL